MKKLFTLILVLSIGLCVHSQQVVTQKWKGVPTRLYVGADGIALLYFSSLKVAKTKISSPQEEMKIVTGKYNFWIFRKNAWVKYTSK